MAESTTAKQSSPTTERATIVLAGATGDLGHRIGLALLARGAVVRALVRPGSAHKPEVAALREQGAELVEVDFNSVTALTKACTGAACVVSALSGLREVIVDLQKRLLDAAVAAGVPRFIPSDYCIDYTKLPVGSNRNLDLRREFNQRLDQAPIQATSVLNGMFTDLLTGQAPVVLFKIKRVMYYGDADQPLDFTTTANTAEFTAAAALDPTTPRYLRVAGEVATVRGLQKAASQATGQPFKLLRMGGVWVLGALIKVTKALMPASDDVFPPWQGMQYMHNMFTGRPKLQPLDNARYPDIRWTPVREVLATRAA
ncbi:NmrA family NAD(P)-binding protein [Hymenobacter sp. BT770]|uniref:NmrA family NAD(P)-binding protein n=1 Tax=Hymenobacter sp. BT770 TaxID=2886942 RepID=UPI001D120394|nr:NmrA family NAD(P)-binding protein [Hymenobacter sp. BT770]MCC3151567.1 NmrA family NAD(P)-binding protein [Hymenobacter sp. BT770]MDO3413856.1 NmrA family NAD(P)-binding protein [Hymenobacter sp. BT770]